MYSEIKNLINIVITFVDSKPSAKTCKTQVRKVFREFMGYLADTGQPFNEDKAFEWAEINTSSHIHGAYYRHYICMLVDLLHDIPLEHNKVYKAPEILDLSETWSMILDRYLSELRRELKASDTIRFSKSATIYFLHYLDEHGCSVPEELTPELCFGINDALTICSTAESKRAYLYKIRMFIRFLQREYGVSQALEYSINTHMRVPYHLVSILTDAQSREIITHRQADNEIEARAYAITVLARYLGIRSRDINNLKFSDIDWKNDTIRILQQKTKSEVLLPLIPCVGNALMHYILNFRPRSESDYIFVSRKYPHSHLISRTTVYQASLTMISDRPESQEAGLHIMRRTLASDMLRYNVKHEIVSAALGHGCTESIDPYIRIHDESLRKCSLSTERFGIPEVLK